MQLLGLLAATALPGLAAAATTPPTYAQADIDSGKVLQQLSKTAYDAAWGRLPASGAGCTKANVKVRVEWYVAPTTRDWNMADPAAGARCRLRRESTIPMR